MTETETWQGLLQSQPGDVQLPRESHQDRREHSPMMRQSEEVMGTMQWADPMAPEQGKATCIPSPPNLRDHTVLAYIHI